MIGTTSSGIWYQQRYVVKVMFLIGTHFTISRCRSRYEADLAVAVVSFISRSIGLMQST
jgi:hypothetical protein